MFQIHLNFYQYILYQKGLDYSINYLQSILVIAGSDYEVDCEIQCMISFVVDNGLEYSRNY